MHLLRRILLAFVGMNIPMLKDLRLQLIKGRSVVFKRIKWIIAALLLSFGFFGITCTNTTSDQTHTKLEVVEPQTIKTILTKHVVTIKDMKYNPAVTQAHIGDTILFVNKDLVAHNIADSLTKEWLSPQLNFGEEWSMVVSENLHFYCAFHPSMEGDIQLATPLSAQRTGY